MKKEGKYPFAQSGVAFRVDGKQIRFHSLLLTTLSYFLPRSELASMSAHVEHLHERVDESQRRRDEENRENLEKVV